MAGVLGCQGGWEAPTSWNLFGKAVSLSANVWSVWCGRLAAARWTTRDAVVAKGLGVLAGAALPVATRGDLLSGFVATLRRLGARDG